MLIGSLITIFVAVTIVVVAFYQPTRTKRPGGGSRRPFPPDVASRQGRRVDGDGLSGSWIEDRHGAFL